MVFYRPDLENLKQQLKFSQVKEIQKSKITDKENINLNNNKAILAVIERPIEKKPPAVNKTLIKNVLKKSIPNSLIVTTVKEVKKNVKPIAMKTIAKTKMTAPSVITNKAPVKPFISKNLIVSCTIYFVMFFFF